MKTTQLLEKIKKQDVFNKKIDNSIQYELIHFIEKEVKEFKPDFLLVVERKGTATIRAIKEKNKNGINIKWEQIISSNSIEYFDSNFFLGKKILVFDEMLRKGRHLKEVLNRLFKIHLEKLERYELKVMVFAVHKDAPALIELDVMDKKNFIAYNYYYSGLSTSAYTKIRHRIIEVLQKSGSLLLDTEHVEIKIKLKCGLQQFLNAISRNAKTSIFKSAGGLFNITVQYEDDEAHRINENSFPINTRFTSIVKKCRIIQRNNDEFAIIPIVIPAIPEHCEKQKFYDDYLKLFGKQIDSEKGLFYCFSLISSIDSLFWIFKDLVILGQENYEIKFPSITEEICKDDGYHLEHLKVVYPFINLSMIRDEILKIWTDAERKGHNLKNYVSKNLMDNVNDNLDDVLLTYNAIQLLQLIREKLDDFRVARYQLGELKDFSSLEKQGLKVEEIFNLGYYLGLDKLTISAIYDVLINDASIVTLVENLKDNDGIRRLQRTFMPDGEIVSEAVRNYTYCYGLPLGCDD